MNEINTILYAKAERQFKYYVEIAQMSIEECNMKGIARSHELFETKETLFSLFSTIIMNQAAECIQYRKSQLHSALDAALSRLEKYIDAYDTAKTYIAEHQ